MADRVTVAEAAAILGVSEDVVRKRLQRGTLAGEKQGRTWLVTLRQDATGHRQSATVGGDPARSLEVLQVELESARELLTLTEEQLAAAREEANFLRERITAQEAIIAQLAEAQSEAQRRRDVLEAQSRAALPAGRKRWWWPFGKA